MNQTLFFIFVLAGTCAIPNYIAYSHIKRYKYYKQVKSLNFSHAMSGFILGLPFIILPFTYTEDDKSFMKYAKVKTAIYWARTCTGLFFIGSFLLMYNQVFIK